MDKRISSYRPLNRYVSLVAGVLLFVFSNGQSHYPGQHAGKFAMKDRLTPAIYSFDLQDVKLLESRFTENMQRAQQWLMGIEVKRLLHSFRTNAGVYSGLEGGYTEVRKLAGWESLDCEIRGHTTGHILSGLALMYASTADEKFRIKSDSIVKGLTEVQQALKQDGYLSAFPQELINRNIRGSRAWVPWYTLHKIIAGLIDQYLYCHNKEALDIAMRMGDWAYKKLQAITTEQRTKMLRVEFGGINETFFNLYAISGKPEYKWLGDFFYHNEVLEPLEQETDNLDKKHANTFIPKILGLVRKYELEGSGDGGRIGSFFWNTVVDHHSYCTGSNSDKEHFFKRDSISKHLTGLTGESCNVYNMLKLTRHLFSHSGDVKYADYYEKALFNHILGQQDPATGMISYFLPMLAGAHKVYSTPDSSFWCCVGSGFENQAKLGEAIYYRSDNELYVNLFISSELNWKEKDLRVRQETSFPDGGIIKLSIQSAPADKVAINLRYPTWATKGAMVKVNGKRVTITQKPGSYIRIERSWKIGDKIEASFPMSLRVIPTNDNPRIAAIAYGPIVLAAPSGTEAMIAPAPYSDPSKHNDYYSYDYHVPKNIASSLVLDTNDLANTIRPVAGEKLVFSTVKEGIILKPLYDIHRERYVVYWNLN